MSPLAERQGRAGACLSQGQKEAEIAEIGEIGGGAGPLHPGGRAEQEEVSGAGSGRGDQEVYPHQEENVSEN